MNQPLSPPTRGDVFRYHAGGDEPRAIFASNAWEIIDQLRIQGSDAADQLAARIDAYSDHEAVLRFGQADLELLATAVREVPESRRLRSAGARALRADIIKQMLQGPQEK